MPVRYHTALLGVALSVLLLSPGPSQAQLTQLVENAAAPSSDTPANSPPAETAKDTATEPQKNGFLAGAWESMTEEAHVTIGYGTLEIQLKIRRNSDGATATMAQKNTSAIFVNYGSKPSFFKDSNFGYSFLVNYVGFDMGQQVLYNNTYVDLNTDVEGQMVYAVPALFYQWGEHQANGKYIRLGLGVGVGAATYSGTIQLTGSQNPDEKIYAVNTSYSPRLAYSNFLEARWNHIGVSVSYAAPRIYGDEYNIKVSNFTAYVGYSIYF
jgi:hypothetical protein